MKHCTLMTMIHSAKTIHPRPMAMFLVHFKSRDLEVLHRQGQFWHIFFPNGGVIISQDEEDTWTTHLPIPLGTKVETLSPEEAVYEVLGGSVIKQKIKIDKILVTSTWRANLCVADRYRSEKKRVFLAGDSGEISVQLCRSHQHLAYLNGDSTPKHPLRRVWNEHWPWRRI